MSTELVSQETKLLEKIRSDEFREQLAHALPPKMSVERFERVTVTAISNNPALIAVDRRTLYNAILKCAQDGLLPDGREAALLDVNDRKAQGGKAARYMPMIGGYRRLAANHGISLEAFVVFENDMFEYEFGLDPKLVHRPAPAGTRGQPIAAYAIAKRSSDGERWFDVMEKAEIEAVRESSKAATSEYGPWVKAWTEMARKTVARRLFKSLPFPNGLSEREVALMEAGDSDVEFEEPRMTKGQAELHASIGNSRPPDDEGPDDSEFVPTERGAEA